MRTLAVAYAETTAERCEDALRNPQLLFVAVAAIADPVRDDVPAAVARSVAARRTEWAAEGMARMVWRTP